MMTSIPLTEPERRRVEFAGGVPIVMPDGAPWRFFEPRPEVRPVRGENGAEEFAIAWDFGGPGIDVGTNDSLGIGFARILTKTHDARNKADRTRGMLEAAWYLLARNYVISQEEFEDLLLRGAVHGTVRRNRLYDGLRGVALAACDRMRLLVEAEAKERSTP